MKEFFKRNLPVFIIGGITLVVFLVIILLSNTRNTTNPTSLVEVIPEEKLVTSESYVLGNTEAPVTLVEFSDFECPACKSFYPVVKNLYETNSKYLKVVYRHYPLPQHPWARKAAEAAEAAGAQGKFWEYSGILFENQPNFSRENFIKFAGDLSLDVTKFVQELDGGTYTEKINEDIKAGQSLNVNSTPTFFLNGRKMDFKSFGEFQDSVEEAVRIAKEEAAAANPEAPEETPESTPTEREPLTVTRQETLRIDFTDNGFMPPNTTAYTGQLVRFENKSSQNLVFIQTVNFFSEFEKEKTVVPGDGFEFKPDKEKLWTFKDNATGKIGSIYIRAN